MTPISNGTSITVSDSDLLKVGDVFTIAGQHVTLPWYRRFWHWWTGKAVPLQRYRVTDTVTDDACVTFRRAEER